MSENWMKHTKQWKKFSTEREADAAARLYEKKTGTPANWHWSGEGGRYPDGGYYMVALGNKHPHVYMTEADYNELMNNGEQ